MGNEEDPGKEAMIKEATEFEKHKFLKEHRSFDPLDLLFTHFEIVEENTLNLSKWVRKKLEK